MSPGYTMIFVSKWTNLCKCHSEKTDTKALHGPPRLRIPITSAWKIEWNEIFLKSKLKQQGYQFQALNCSAIILKWIINIQSKKEKWTCQVFSPFIVSSINSYSSLKTHCWHITCEAYPALSNGVNLSPFWVTWTGFYLHLTPALRVLHMPLPLSMKGKDSVLFISCF